MLSGGIETLTGADTFTGGTTVDTGATLNLTNDAGAGTGGITLQPGSTLGLNNVAITDTVNGSGDPNINVTGASSMPTYTGDGHDLQYPGTDNSATTDVLTVTTANATYAGTTNVGGTAAGSSVTLTGGAANALAARRWYQSLPAACSTLAASARRSDRCRAQAP